MEGSCSMENKIEQAENAIIQTVINGTWKSILTQTSDKEGHMQIIREVFEGKELRERTEYII